MVATPALVEYSERKDWRLETVIDMMRDGYYVIEKIEFRGNALLVWYETMDVDNLGPECNCGSAFHRAITKNFEIFSTYCRAFLDLIPITFVLGFYVSIVITRWWEQYMAIPFPDRVNMQIATFVKGTDERSRLIRRSLTRYVNLMSILVFRNVSKPIMKRFPTMDHLIEAGILTIDERLCLEETPCAHGNWWIPSNWFMSLVSVARQEGRITDDYHLKMIIDEMLAVRGCAGMMFSYDWISVPLVYTQVVTVAVYCFVVASIFGRQYLFEIPEYGTALPNYVDYYFPLFTTFQFFFYMGWLKVAEELICAYGDDDDDFDINWCIDRNVQTSYMMVDELYNKHPALTRDAFWDEIHAEVPYTEAAADYKQSPFIGSAADIEVSAKHQEWAAPSAADQSHQPSIFDNQSLRKRSVISNLSTNNNTNRTSNLALDIEKQNGTKTSSANGTQSGSVRRKASNATLLKHKLSHLAARHRNSHLDVSSQKVRHISGNFAHSSRSSFRSRSPSMLGSENRVSGSVVPHPNAIEEYNTRKRDLLRTQASAFAATYESGAAPPNNDQEDNLSIISALVSSAADSPKAASHRFQRSLCSSGGRDSELNRQEMKDARQSVARSVSQTDSACYENQAIHNGALPDATRITESIHSVCPSPTPAERKLTTVNEEDSNVLDA